MPVQRPPQEAIDLLEQAVKRSKRTSGARLPGTFVRDQNNKIAAPPLAALLRGGGGVRIRVFLTVTMMATKPPHTTRISARELARMLNVADPDRAGTRRVAKAFLDLERAGLMQRERRPGYVPETTVLDPGGSGDAWSDRALPEGYVSLPADFWQRGWIVALSGRAIALLLILTENTHKRPNNQAWVPGYRKRQYGLSDDTWSKAIKELQDAGLLEVEERVYASQGEPRRRNLYTLHPARLSQFDPGEVPGADQ